MLLKLAGWQYRLLSRKSKHAHVKTNIHAPKFIFTRTCVRTDASDLNI
jgi:hypothetical protein